MEAFRFQSPAAWGFSVDGDDEAQFYNASIMYPGKQMLASRLKLPGYLYSVNPKESQVAISSPFSYIRYAITCDTRHLSHMHGPSVIFFHHQSSVLLLFLVFSDSLYLMQPGSHATMHIHAAKKKVNRYKGPFPTSYVQIVREFKQKAYMK